MQTSHLLTNSTVVSYCDKLTEYLAGTLIKALPFIKFEMAIKKCKISYTELPEEQKSAFFDGKMSILSI